MVPLTLYVETSVWSFAFAEDAPNYRDDTPVFFDRCRSGVLQPVVRVLVPEEIDRATGRLREELLRLLHEIDPVVVDVSDRARELAEAFVRGRAVPASKPEDARHVAVAFDEELDVLVS